MAVKKELGHPYDATNSWNGYSHQGKIALWYAIQTIIKLWDDLDAEQNCKNLEEYFLELEYEEDFSIGKITSQIMGIRTNLCNFTEKANKIDGICPYCGQEWGTQEALTQQFNKTTERLSQIFGRESTAFDNVLKELRALC